MDSSSNNQPSNPPHPSLSHQLTTHSTPPQSSASPLSSAQQETSNNESHLPADTPLNSASAEQLDEIEMATAMRFKRALEKSLGMEFPEEPNQFAKDLGCHTAADCDAKLTDLDRFLATLPASGPHHAMALEDKK
ncbi:hypothetical protein I302_104749 [Kwoniella bestiolae CBS 10118]|uniref:Uncharacterized protein n=1 Tax=Kwoniella bestiolae CBS 10118 TaxID=1296100 RepID=A0A1B9FRX4_9TREE|nr:hypothetical protein I302_09181 [Kwoniella bestiolae CBS 10118]OCF21502.1 hypothetical protein I302_09181 [Kwoniella bestiolae CBS 10118]